jgi:hypothetical protein
MFTKVKSNIENLHYAWVLFQIILEFSQGAEHGHTHGHVNMSIPWLLFISLCIHAFLEGFPTSDLAVGIAIHHLPIAIILTTFLLIRICTKAIFWLYAHLCINDSIGTLASDFLPILNDYYTEITALVIGILFHISSTIIFEAVKDIQYCQSFHDRFRDCIGLFL